MRRRAAEHSQSSPIHISVSPFGLATLPCRWGGVTYFSSLWRIQVRASSRHPRNIGGWKWRKTTIVKHHTPAELSPRNDTSMLFTEKNGKFPEVESEKARWGFFAYVNRTGAAMCVSVCVCVCMGLHVMEKSIFLYND